MDEKTRDLTRAVLAACVSAEHPKLLARALGWGFVLIEEDGAKKWHDAPEDVGALEALLPKAQKAVAQLVEVLLGGGDGEPSQAVRTPPAGLDQGAWEELLWLSATPQIGKFRPPSEATAPPGAAPSPAEEEALLRRMKELASPVR